MNETEKLLISKALDGLWGAIDAGRELCDLLVDSTDGRIENMRDALGKSQDAILELNEAWGIGKH